MGRRGRVLLVIGVVIAAFLAYEVATYFVAYTDDAYVRTDLVAVAPEVTGPIVKLYVHDNQPIKRGDPLFTIDPVPFRLVVDQKQAEISEAKAQIVADEHAIAVAQDRYQAATSALAFARATQSRYTSLNHAGFMPRQSLDRVTDELQRAMDALSAAQAAIAQAGSVKAMHEGTLALAEAEMGTAQWRLSKTRVVSPTDGRINNLTVRVGDTATVNTPIIGILDAHAWRVVANYKQYYLRGFRPGDRVWVWLDSEPWHLHRAHIGSLGQGISRNPDEAMLLPYVAPTTDWIRLQRRFPVTIYLDEPPPDGQLFMGADARTVIFPH
jgi:membrane fusion protein, multidrug efflux system